MARKKHAESHGGAWKVAYADFVTAMMALFMVLWISAQQKEILIATSKYFQNPFTSPMPASSGVMEGKRERIDSDENASPSRTFTPEMYAQLAKEFLKLLDVNQKDDKPIDIKVERDSIQILVYNRDKQKVFEDGSTKLTSWGEYVAQNLAWLIDRFHLRVRIDSHTPKGMVANAPDTDLFDLTSDQANVMRRTLVHYGLESSKIDHVTGFGDTAPIRGLAPQAPDNYRLEMSLSATPDTPTPILKQ